MAEIITMGIITLAAVSLGFFMGYQAKTGEKPQAPAIKVPRMVPLKRPKEPEETSFYE